MRAEKAERALDGGGDAAVDVCAKGGGCCVDAGSPAIAEQAAFKSAPSAASSLTGGARTAASRSGTAYTAYW